MTVVQRLIAAFSIAASKEKLSTAYPFSSYHLYARAMSVVGAAGTTTDDQTNADERRANGEFVRGVSTARNWISASDPDAKYKAEMGRYHMYVAYNCPCKLVEQYSMSVALLEKRIPHNHSFLFHRVSSRLIG